MTDRIRRALLTIRGVLSVDPSVADNAQINYDKVCEDRKVLRKQIRELGGDPRA